LRVFVEERFWGRWSGRTLAGRQRLGLIIAFKKLFYHALLAFAVPQYQIRFLSAANFNTGDPYSRFRGLKISVRDKTLSILADFRFFPMYM
jgi:hypothetical protein